MSSPTPPTPSRALSVFSGVLAAFVSFAVVAALFQGIFGGPPSDEEYLAERKEIETQQHDALKKLGLSGNPLPVFEKALSSVQARKVTPSKVVVPGSPTAIKASQEAPPDEEAPAAPAPAAPAPAAPAPAAPAPAAPAPTVSPASVTPTDAAPTNPSQPPSA